MRLYSSSLQHLTAITSSAASSSTAMNFTSRYRGGGRRQWQRDFSDQTTTGTGLVQDADLRFQVGDGGHSPNQTGSPQPHAFNGRRPFNHRQSFRQPSSDNQGQSFQYRPPSPFHQTQQFPQQQDYTQNQRIYRPAPNIQGQQFYQPLQQHPDQSLFRPPPYYQNSSAGPAQQRAPRPPRDLVHRNWEFARTAVPPDCKRFVVLSYNLLADYLAINHKSKLYFHIPHYMLEWNWRKRNIIFELGLWSADILCLQEVDRFQELEEELKLRGYCGIWKMRTGDPVDGCAIFWRTSRFKLLHEESIEFIELGLRDNVAQICVLGLINEDKTEDRDDLPQSSVCADKIVLCNIHLLYNPKRGDIKLGQIRVLLEKAHYISNAWDNAPVVLCGDFNCTPKSPMYNFISEQQLSLSGLDRDKVSGQASAEIHLPRLNYRNNGDQPSYRSTEAPVKVDISEEHRSSSASSGSVPTIDNSNQIKCIKFLMDEWDKSCTNRQVVSEDRERTDELKENVMLVAGSHTLDETNSPSSSCNKIEGYSLSQEMGGLPLDLEIDEGDNLASVVSKSEDASFDVTATRNEDTSSGCSPSSIVKKNNSGENEFCCNESMDEKLKASSLNDPVEFSMEGGSSSEFEDDSTFVAALHNLEDPNLQLSGGILDESSSFLEVDHVEERQVSYDPCIWTPVDIATATGREDCLNLEHKLKLKSTYTEVEDVSGTRDANGEPLATSYHRRFMGTVDYIWRSEGLQTVRTRAPIPKTAMQWTEGFPTKKWGSDHIALVSELAFVRGWADREADVQ